MTFLLENHFLLFSFLGPKKKKKWSCGSDDSAFLFPHRILSLSFCICVMLARVRLGWYSCEPNLKMKVTQLCLSKLSFISKLSSTGTWLLGYMLSFFSLANNWKMETLYYIYTQISLHFLFYLITTMVFARKLSRMRWNHDLWIRVGFLSSLGFHFSLNLYVQVPKEKELLHVLSF